MEEFVTKAEFRSLGADPRTVRKHIEPDAKLLTAGRVIELFRRERVQLLAAELFAAAERNSDSK